MLQNVIASGDLNTDHLNIYYVLSTRPTIWIQNCLDTIWQFVPNLNVSGIQTFNIRIRTVQATLGILQPSENMANRKHLHQVRSETTNVKKLSSKSKWEFFVLHPKILSLSTFLGVPHWIISKVDLGLFSMKHPTSRRCPLRV